MRSLGQMLIGAAAAVALGAPALADEAPSPAQPTIAARAHLTFRPDPKSPPVEARTTVYMSPEPTASAAPSEACACRAQRARLQIVLTTLSAT